MPQFLWCICSVHLGLSGSSLRVIKDLLEKDPTLKDRTVLTVNCIIQLLGFCLKHMYFSFQDQVYEQVGVWLWLPQSAPFWQNYTWSI